jgi:hypothetical protein
MNQSVHPGPRTWALEPKGVVQFEGTPKQLPTLSALQCLGTRANAVIHFEVSPNLLGSGEVNPAIVTLDLQKGHWSRDTGLPFDVEKPAIRPLAVQAVKKAKDALNRALRDPLDVHLRLCDIKPQYDMRLCTDRPAVTFPKRVWRRADATWIAERPSAIVALEGPPRDCFDRAFDLIARLDRPAEMRWTYSGLHDGVHHIALQATTRLRHPLVSVCRVGTTLGIDIHSSLSGQETEMQVLSTQMMALAQALRRYAGHKLAPLIVTAFETRTADANSAPRPLLQLQVGSHGWTHALGKAVKQSVSELRQMPYNGFEFVTVAAFGWIDPPTQ